MATFDAFILRGGSWNKIADATTFENAVYSGDVSGLPHYIRESGEGTESPAPLFIWTATGAGHRKYTEQAFNSFNTAIDFALAEIGVGKDFAAIIAAECPRASDRFHVRFWN